MNEEGTEAGTAVFGNASDPLPAEHRMPPKVSFVTFWLIAINVLVFIVMVASGVPLLSPTALQVLPWGASFAPITLNGQWWRILTACFVHFGIIHIGMNMIILYQIGLLAELLFGRVRFLILYLLSGLFGGLVSLYIHPLGTSAGASGAIFGLFGGLLAFLLVERNVVPTSESIKIAKSAGVFLLYNLAFGIADSRTDLSAHGGGLVAGFILGIMLAKRDRSPTQLVPHLRTAAVVVCSLMLIVAGYRVLARTNPNHSDWYREILLNPSVPLGAQSKLVYVGVPRAEAQKLAQGIQNLGLAKTSNTIMLYSKTSAVPTLSIPVGRDEATYKPQSQAPANASDGQSAAEPAEPLPWNDPRAVGSFTATGIALAPLVGGPPLKILLLNSKGDLRRTIYIDIHQLTIGKKDSIWYSGTSTDTEARALAGALQAVGLFRDKGSRVWLTRSPSGATLSFFVPDGSGDNQQLVTAIASIARMVAPAVGGPPLTVNLVNSSLEATKTFIVK